jgi:hypothetical protein
MKLARTAILFCLLLLLAGLALAQTYHLGPRGGCYTITSSGNKHYVDRSMCKPGGIPPAQGKYLRGSRGGCYTVDANGNKHYVDRNLCS